MPDRDAHDRIEVLDRIVERPVLEQRLVDVRQRAAEQQRVAVGLRAGDRGGAHRGAGAADVLDHHGAEQRLDPVRPRPAEPVIGAARRERYDEADRTLRIALRRRETCAREHAAHGEMQNVSARWEHQ